MCAAVSALMYALAGYLEETGQAARSDIRRGYADIEGAGDCGAAFTLVRYGAAGRGVSRLCGDDRVVTYHGKERL